MYATEWHTVHAAKTEHSAWAILPDLLTLFHVASVLEVGCGNAHWTSVAVMNGVGDHLAVDGPWNVVDDLVIDPDHYQVRDLTKPLAIGRQFDMAICLEVAEHLDLEYADIIVDSLASSADVIVFSAAIPLQGGFRHVNEQWGSWWRAKFSARGFEAFDLIRPKHWSDTNIHFWYRQNTFVYVRTSNAAAIAAAKARQQELYAGPIMFDAVQPEKYDEMASYRTIQGKRLAKRLPRWLVSRLRLALHL
ncbi:hypothetical protein ABLE91_02040 [Aquabacter sp. CN5-332]|uniref:hypothetical protein n=1 Tax=Aquabacter sp. CN5-332 TaxID=3156608 RepID=UPI0032B4FB18